MKAYSLQYRCTTQSKSETTNAVLVSFDFDDLQGAVWVDLPGHAVGVDLGEGELTIVWQVHSTLLDRADRRRTHAIKIWIEKQ